jgi:hypothetical protein
MGQAKNRGTFEERAEQARKRAELEASQNELAKQAAEYARAQRLAELPPEARQRAMQRNRVSNLRIASLMGLVCALAVEPKPKEPQP